jgi:hypothetical protein
MVLLLLLLIVLVMLVVMSTGAVVRHRCPQERCCTLARLTTGQRNSYDP